LLEVKKVGLKANPVGQERTRKRGVKQIAKHVRWSIELEKFLEGKESRKKINWGGGMVAWRKKGLGKAIATISSMREGEKTRQNGEFILSSYLKT